MEEIIKKEKENLISEITERTDESDAKALETSPREDISPGKINAALKNMKLDDISSAESVDSEAVLEKITSIYRSEETNNGSQNKKNEKNSARKEDIPKPRAPSDFEDIESSDVDKMRSSNNSKDQLNPTQNRSSMKSSKSTEQLKESDRSSIENQGRVILSKRIQIKDRILGFKLLEKAHHGNDDPASNEKLKLKCFDFTNSKPFNFLRIPKDLIDMKKLTLDSILNLIEINVEDHLIHFKKGLSELRKEKAGDSEVSELSIQPLIRTSSGDFSPELRQKTRLENPSTIQEVSHNEETDIRDEKRRNKGESEEEDTIQDLQPLVNVASYEQKGADFLATVSLKFDKLVVRANVLYDKKNSEVIVIPETKYSKFGKLNVSTEELGLKAFSKDYLVENIDYLLLRKVSLRNNQLIFTALSQEKEIQEEISLFNRVGSKWSFVKSKMTTGRNRSNLMKNLISTEKRKLNWNNG